jgi:hypothetical protein
MHQGALALIDVEEGAANCCRQRAADQTANRLKTVTTHRILTTTDGVFWQISGKWRLRALRACNRPGAGPGLACWFGVEPPAGIEPATPSLPFVWSGSYRDVRAGQRDVSDRE